MIYTVFKGNKPCRMICDNVNKVIVDIDWILPERQNKKLIVVQTFSAQLNENELEVR